MTVKRFIAGAVCPRCSTMDKLRAWRDDEIELQYRECIECGYTDQQSTKIQAQPVEIATRVNKALAHELEVEETVIQFVPNVEKPTKH